MQPETLASEPQHLQALRLANQVRRDRMALIRGLTTDEVTLADALADPAAARMPVLRLLMAQRQWGRERAVALLRRTWISEQRPCGQLTDRQRDLIVRLAGGARAA